MTKTMNIIHQIEANLNQMTRLEKMIAHYFLTANPDEQDLSSADVSHKLHVSPAALTRFAQKAGFRGYREFIFEYLNNQRALENDFLHIQKDLTKRILLDYKKIVTQTNEMIDEEKLDRVTMALTQSKRVYFYGVGSSGLVAREAKLRFMRLGMICEAITDSESFIWANGILNQDCLVFGLSLTGQTQSVIKALDNAKKKGAKTVLVSSIDQPTIAIDEHIKVASVRHLSYGIRISPQLPLLMMIDALYAYYLAIDQAKKEDIFRNTITDLD